MELFQEWLQNPDLSSIVTQLIVDHVIKHVLRVAQNGEIISGSVGFLDNVPTITTAIVVCLLSVLSLLFGLHFEGIAKKAPPPSHAIRFG